MPCGGHGIKTQKLHCATVCQAGKYPGWWFQPVWKRCSSNWKSSPTFRGEKWKTRWNHHLDWLCNYLVGGFNLSEKYARQIGSFPQVGLETKIFELPPPSYEHIPQFSPFSCPKLPTCRSTSSSSQVRGSMDGLVFCRRCNKASGFKLRLVGAYWLTVNKICTLIKTLKGATNTPKLLKKLIDTNFNCWVCQKFMQLFPPGFTVLQSPHPHLFFF